MERQKIQEEITKVATVKDFNSLDKYELDSVLLDSASMDDDPLLENNPAIENAVNALTHGADLNARIGVSGPNLLFLAASENKIALFDWLLRVTKDGKKIDVNYRLNDEMPFLDALLKEHVSSDMIKKFVDTFNVDVNSKDTYGSTPLMRALFANNTSNLRLLLDNGANPNQTFNKYNVAPLLFAASECFDDTVIPLVSAGADLKAVDTDGHNALMLSLMRNPLTLPKSKRAGLYKTIDFLLSQPDTAVNLAPGLIQPLFSVMHFDEYAPLFVKMLNRGANPNALYDTGFRGAGLETPLHVAAKMGKQEYVIELLKHGAKMSVENKYGTSPESYLMLNPDTQFMFMSLVNNNGLKFNPNAVYGELDKNNEFSATKVKKATVLQMLMLQNEFNNENKDSDRNIQKDLIELLVSSGANKTLKDKPELHASEPMFTAMGIGSVDFAKSLIDSGELDYSQVFNIGDEFVKNEHNYLSYLVSEADFLNARKLDEIYKEGLLTVKDEISKKSSLGSGSLSEENRAKEKAKVKDEVSEALSKAKSDLNLAAERAFKKQLSILDLVLKKAGVDTLAAPLNDKGENAIFKIKNPIWFELLKNKGFDILPKDSNGYTPLDKAIINNDKKIVTGYKELVSIPENTLYKLAFLDTNSFSIVKQINMKLGVVSTLYNEEKYAEYNKFSDEYVFPHNNLVDYKDDDGNTPLLVATASNNELIATLSIQMGADVNVINNNGETALQYACLNGLNSFAKKLIESGADITVKNADGYTAYDLASESKMIDVMHKMEEVQNKTKLKI